MLALKNAILASDVSSLMLYENMLWFWRLYIRNYAYVYTEVQLSTDIWLVFVASPNGVCLSSRDGVVAAPSTLKA